MIYILTVQIEVTEFSMFNAAQKAPDDMVRIVKNFGGQELILRKQKSGRKLADTLLYYFRTLAFSMKAAARFRKGDILIVQRRMSIPKVRMIAAAVKLRGGRMVLLLHDMDFLRTNKELGLKHRKNAIQVKFIKQFPIIIMHTPAMEAYARGIGIGSQTYHLNLFDYLTDGSQAAGNVTDEDKNQVVFAGNLEKSEFLKPLNNRPIEEIRYNLYGFAAPSFLSNEGLCYCGKFAADHISEIKGGWGLVWDGNSADTCAGSMGEYLRYNSSHKASLYLAAGLPLVLWEESSLKDFARENNIGITVGSLDELPGKIAAVSDSEYRQMRENAARVGKKLREGGMLTGVLTEIDGEKR